MPSERSASISAQSSWRTCGSSPTVGSSSSTSRGRWTSARAISRRRRIPPESLSTRVSRRSTSFAIFERPLDRLGPVGAADPVEVGEDEQVLLDGQRRVEVVELRDDAALGAGRLRLARQPEAQHLDLALVGDRLRREEPHRRRLPGAVRAEQADAGADRDVEVQVVDRGDRPVALHDAAQADGELVAHAFSMPAAGLLVETTGVFSGLGIVPLVLIFAAAAAAVWVAGIHLSSSTDALDTRLGLGEALGGAVLLAIATNLPEIAITASAALAHDLGIAIGNILGGIAIQTVVLVVLDVAMGKESALTTRAASLVLGLEGLLVVLVLAISVMGAQLPAARPFGRFEPAALLIALCWLVGVWLVNRARRGLPWHDTTGTAPGAQEKPRGHSKAVAAEKMSLARAAAIFAAGGGGDPRARASCSSEAASRSPATSASPASSSARRSSPPRPRCRRSRPGIASVKLGDYQLAVSDIFGGNAFLPVLFLLASLLSGSAVLPQAQPTDIYLTALGIVLTVVYGWGLITRPQPAGAADGPRLADGARALRWRASPGSSP